MSTPARTLDVSGLPDVVFGKRSLIWLGTMGLIAIELTMFVLVIASYFYLRTRENQWPPGINDPRLLPGTINLVVFLLSGIPNYWLNKKAHAGELTMVRLGLLIVSAVAIVNLLIRIFEFYAMQCRWDANAYASVVWFLLGLHTVHLLTDAYDTWVLTVLMFRDRLVEGKRFMDVSENADYWWFVVLTWVPVYLTIYVAPRLL